MAVEGDQPTEPAQAAHEHFFGKYQLLDRIATGGMAEVFRAYSTSIGGFQKLVALKRILPHLSTDAEFVSLFIDEAKLTVSLNHGNVVQVFDFGRIENNYFIAMEYVDGRDLTQVLMRQARRNAPIPSPVACYVLVESLRGLEYAHTRRARDGAPLGLVHRDVSPHNVLISFDGEVKITDFGIAKARTKVSLTRPGIVLGKFAYMSPEQARGQDIDLRSDVYSAGITLYETLTGRRLFYSEDPAQILARVRDPRVVPPSRLNPDIPTELDAIVLRALEVDRDRRFSNCREFATALQGHLLDVAPELNDSHITSFMKELFEEDVGAAKFSMAADRPAPQRGATERIVALTPSMMVRPVPDRELAVLEDPLVVALTEQLRREPNLWTLVELGSRFERMSRTQEAERVYRAAALKFAQNGLLVQAVALFVQIRDLRGWNADLALQLEAVRNLPGQGNDALERCLGPLGSDELDVLLTEILLSQGPSRNASLLVSPLFSLLDAAEFANLVSLLQLKRIAPGATIMREGEPGECLCILARGRVLIYCRNFYGNKVYLSSLSDGDCFGEFSFFTGAPRAATVEALEEVLIFEIAQRDFDTVIERFPNLTSALLRFYKQRVVSTLLAKSEVFGVLRTREREWLLDRLKLETRERAELIVREGEASEAFYLIKSGEVEVFSERNGYVFLNKLKSGDFFGESAAVTGQVRSASVRALGTCELLRLGDTELQDLMTQVPEVREVLVAHIALREAETARRLTAGGLLI